MHLFHCSAFSVSMSDVILGWPPVSVRGMGSKVNLVLASVILTLSAHEYVFGFEEITICSCFWALFGTVVGFFGLVVAITNSFCRRSVKGTTGNSSSYREVWVM